MSTFIGLKREVQRNFYLLILCLDLQRFNKTHLYAYLIKREIMNVSMKSQDCKKYSS